ncbi:hypothetical protein F2P81_020096 [Scophthalmus maximus]|uniref:Potassium channel subfamily K member 12 n=1 Tax=Scophthalmus maximus TaxID=52904 RepID=A0A6A4S530_SCOMX|nr:hypothetical protein F2P81_020096 [Scophthalmus maximus]
MMPDQRAQGCRSLHLNEDNGRFVLLALLIVLYLLCGAAVFSAIERPSEQRAHGRWNGTLLNFSETFNVSLRDLSSFLREYEAAIAAGIRADALRPRWDFTGAFYFVGTVVSTIDNEIPVAFDRFCTVLLRSEWFVGAKFDDRLLFRGERPTKCSK